MLKKLTFLSFIVAISLNVYIYTYPSLNAENCSWKHSQKSISSWEQRIVRVPYIGDLYSQYFIPQPKSTATPRDIHLLALGDPQIKGNWPSTPYRARLDTFGNDFYLGHIYRVMKNRLEPDFVSVMGDQFSSQWISDREFFNRTRRYINRLFPQPHEQSGYVLDFIAENNEVDWVQFMNDFQKMQKEGTFEFGYSDVYQWSENVPLKEPMFINLTGNHDIGYGDSTYQHMARFNRLFGKDNYYIEYDLATEYPWRIVVLNSLALDGPLLQPEFQEYTWSFVKELESRPFNGSTILLTHIPFYKKEGLCSDGPFTDFYTKENAKEEYRIGLLKSTNHLSYNTTQRVLNAIFQNGKPGIVLTGHDHEGCESLYHKRPSGEWEASKDVESDVYVKEVVVRAMMGDFGGNSGLMTGHFNEESSEWEFDYSLCPFMVQHVWWATQLMSIVSLLLLSLCFRT